jgi:hypothetical protein
MASGMIIAQVNELITSKVGGDNQTNSFLSALITVGTTVAAAALAPAAIPALGKGASVAAKAIEAGIGAAGSMAGTALNHSLSYSTTETKKDYSIHEFKHKYQFSGKRPLKMRLE